MKIGLIGVGNMGEALLAGLLYNTKSEDVFFTAQSSATIKRILHKYNITNCRSNLELALECQVIILATKPNIYYSIIEEILPALAKDKILISITPSFSIAKLEQLSGHRAIIVRTIPNTPVKVRAGIILTAFQKDVDIKTKQLIDDIFSPLGKVIEIKEEYFAVASSLSGSSPALVEYLIKAFIEYGLTKGIDPQIVKKLVVDSFSGTSKLVDNSSEDLLEMIDAVCSKGGSTIEGIEYLDKSEVTTIIFNSLDAITRRFLQMEQD